LFADIGGREPCWGYSDQLIAARTPALPHAEASHAAHPMHWSDPPLTRRDVITIPILWVAIVLSLLVHVTALWLAWPHLHLISTDQGKPAESSTLAVQLTPQNREAASTPPAAPSAPTIASATPRPPAAPRPARPQRARPPQPRTPQPRAPPVIALDRNADTARPLPAPPVLAAPQPPEPAPEPAPEPPKPPPPTLEGDLASYVEARRAARGEQSSAGSTPSAASAESEKERLNRTVAANLGLNKTPTFGYDPQSAGGIFQITHVGYDDAQFWFFGLDKDIGRNAKQLIDVRKGSTSDIRVAIVRKMIEIIRQNVSGDFLWSSQRAGREIQLSARPSDNAELEQFIMRDVFPDLRATDIAR
jgi:hypothetical protein